MKLYIVTTFTTHTTASLPLSATRLTTEDPKKAAATVQELASSPEEMEFTYLIVVKSVHKGLSYGQEGPPLLLQVSKSGEGLEEPELTFNFKDEGFRQQAEGIIDIPTPATA